MTPRRAHARRRRPWETPDGGLRWWVFALAAVVLLGAGSLASGSPGAPDRRATVAGRAGSGPFAGNGTLPQASRAASASAPLRGSGPDEDPTVPPAVSTAAPAPAAAGPLRPSAGPEAPPACAYGNRPALDARADQWAATMVDTTYRLARDFVPPGLVPVGRAGVGGWGMVRDLVIDDLRAMADAADQAGVPFTVQSAYRGFARQGVVFDGWVARSGEAAALRSSARAGHSEHQLGTALDLRAKGGPEPWAESFATTPTGRWLHDNAWRFGFVVSYPEGAEDVTCYVGEAWHVRYVGHEEAAAVEASGLALRQWLWANR